MPCVWPIPTPPTCCPEWVTFTPDQQAAALDYATVVMWAATGRRFGSCAITVRPCTPKQCSDGGLDWWGGMWGGGSWTPYLFNGNWFNCGCPGICSCDPRCQVQLPGPVSTVIEVRIGGVLIPATSWRVDDNKWLVRTDGLCWPECPDFDTDDGPNVFTVSYVRGEAIPAVVLTAAGTLACEWGKACTGGECRLSNRVQSLNRNGIEISMLDPSELLENGLTGLWEVDTVIRASNPGSLTHRMRILSPDIQLPRTVTTP